ncbi:hypothetical protein EPUS_03163 [Endocarpon pusillum Z07020]|uniref:Uncharacterized protein n=1 Tax=Endocarpon pusillum (strain Z07020 / HMAS-L-300199) TaxID=1263415 RepID=U1HS26_ENDPU|nr:uncharacterized protein EPUS_03163 [Endocarpon pusillum Z07020]ERF73330.1 hypothetical protein EPUS_03163 [Endocarpon pusillum Z07020]
MHFFTFITLVAVLVINLLCTAPAAASRSHQRAHDLDTVKPISELGWTVPLLSGTYALPPPAADKTLKYLTLGRGIMTYGCNGNTPGNDQPVYLYQNTDLYDVTPLAQNLPDEAALHSLVPHFCEYDYAELRNTSMHCVGRIYNQSDHTIVNLFGFNVPEFTIEVDQVIPSPGGQTVDGYWDHCTTIDKEWEMYRVETAGGATPTTCKGHENSTISVAYAAEYWFYHC